MIWLPGTRRRKGGHVEIAATGVVNHGSVAVITMCVLRMVVHLVCSGMKHVSVGVKGQEDKMGIMYQIGRTNTIMI